MSWLRCRPFAFWLVFSALGLSFLLLAALGGGELKAPRATGPRSSADLAVMVPYILSAAGATDGSLEVVVGEFTAKARDHAARLQRKGDPQAAQAYTEVADYAGTLPAEQDVAGARWRAEALGQAVYALGVGSMDPVPDEAWAGPPAPVTTTTVPSAAERLAALDAGR